MTEVPLNPIQRAWRALQPLTGDAKPAAPPPPRDDAHRYHSAFVPPGKAAYRVRRDGRPWLEQSNAF